MNTTISPHRSRLATAAVAAGLCLFILAGCRSAPELVYDIRYPETTRGDHVDDYHGVKIPDPYRWLEDSDSEQTRAWVDAQNGLSRAFLESIPSRAPLEKRLSQLWNYEKFGVPFRRGGRTFLTHNDGLQNQSPLYVLDDLEGEPRLLLDPNELSTDGTISTSGYTVSPDGRYLAYAISRGGSDWREIRVREVVSGRDGDDDLRWVKFSSISWGHDSRGFYYSRFAEPKSEEALRGVNRDHKVYYHEVGTAQSADRLVYERPDEDEWLLGAEATPDGRYLILWISPGSSRNNGIFYQDLASGGVVELLGRFDSRYSYIGNDGDLFYFVTNFGAPLNRVIAIDIHDPVPSHWKEVVPESDAVLERAHMVGGHLVLNYARVARSEIRVHQLTGELVRNIDLPGLGSVRGFRGEPDDPETFFAFSSFTVPRTIYHTHLGTGETRKFRESQVDFDPTDFITEQVFYPSKDGTQIPMFLTYKKGIVRDGSNPTYLYGYGGFNISMTPSFSVSNLVWLEMGGIYAMPNLRGGGEYGQAWHEGGIRKHKQNTFDDFIAAAEWLIEHGYTSTPKLAIGGGSNGGLLVGACMTQRPDLFGACLPAVGVMDMLRFDQFTIGRAWVSDFGSPQDPDDFPTIRAYSPLHNLENGGCYPATLVTTADHDDRVVPAHSYKFASALQAAQGCDRPVLIAIQTRAGHGSGKPTRLRIAEAADQWAFLVEVLGLSQRKRTK